MFRLHIDKHSDLRLLEPRHAEELFAAVDRDRKVLREWLPWVDQTKTATDTHAFIVESLEKLARQQELTAGIWHRGRIAGVLGARLNPLAPSAEIGYWLGAEFQGRGLMTCAVRAVMEYLFEDRGFTASRFIARRRTSEAVPSRNGSASGKKAFCGRRRCSTAATMITVCLRCCARNGGRSRRRSEADGHGSGGKASR